MVESDDDQQILCLLASGIVSAHEDVSAGAALRVPYPLALQRALDRLSLRCVQDDVPPPAGLAELLRWCEEPLGSWPVRLGGEDVAGDVFLDLESPTRACHEWALASDDVEGELFENAVIADVRRIRPPASARRRPHRVSRGAGGAHQRRQARRRRARAGPAQLPARGVAHRGRERGERPTRASRRRQPGCCRSQHRRDA